MFVHEITQPSIKGIVNTFASSNFDINIFLHFMVFSLFSIDILPIEVLSLPKKRMDNISASIIDRIKYLIDQSRMSQAQFASRISIDPSNLSKHLTGKLPISESLINRIVVDMGVSKAWLRDGIGLPYNKSIHARELSSPEQIDIIPTSCTGIPVYDIDVTAGCEELSQMFTSDRIIGAVNLPQLDPSTAIVHVSGDSMEPVIHNRGYIAVRPVSTTNVIFWGQIYVVVMEDYRMVKYLRKHSDPTKVILRSANSAYDDVVVDRDDIIALYLVETILNIKLCC